MAGRDTSVTVLKTITIASGASLSAGFTVDPMQITALDLDANFAGSGISFQVSNDNSSFRNYYNSSGEVIFAATAGTRLTLDPVTMVSIGPYVKIRADTAAAPQAQSQDITIEIIGRILR